jgi:tetratricopeptide (TPR) repeat protein
MSAGDLVLTIRSAFGQDGALARAGIAELGDPRLAAEMPDHRALADKFAGIHAYRSGDFDQAMSHYSQALEGFVQSGNRQEEGNVLNNMGVLHSESGRDPEQAAIWFKRSRDIREALNDTTAVLASHKNLANLWLSGARFEPAREAVSAYVVAARLNGSAADQIDALLLQGDVALGLGEANAASWFEQAHELAVRAGDALMAASAQQRLGRLELRAGRPAEARARFQQALTLFEQSPDSHQRAIVLYNLANAEEALGDATTALAHYQNAETEAPDRHSSLAVDAALGRVRMLWRLDRFPEGESLLAQVNQRILMQDESLMTAAVNIHRSSLALMKNRPMAARALIQDARKLLGQSGDWDLLATLQEQEIWVHLALAEHDAAHSALERLEDQAKARTDQRVLDRLHQLGLLLQVARGSTADAYRNSFFGGSREGSRK